MLNKIVSGRFILTVICGVVFAYVAIMKIIPADTVATIIGMVFISYFNRDRSKENGGTK